MEHIIQFGIAIDDELITRRVLEKAEKEIIKQLGDGVAGELFGRDSFGRVDKSYVADWVHKKVDRFMEDNKAEIVEMAAERLADKLSKTKAVKEAAAKMSKKISQNDDFKKTYLAVCEGEFLEKEGIMQDLLFKDSKKNKSFVVKRERKGVKKAVLRYNILKTGEYGEKMCSLAHVTLETGRSHQIRVQFASRKHPLLGDGKYGSSINCPIALFSHKIETENKIFVKNPTDEKPWNIF